MVGCVDGVSCCVCVSVCVCVCVGYVGELLVVKILSGLYEKTRPHTQTWALHY